MATSYTTRNGRRAKRGLFVDGIWRCDCEPRLPADKFQTKNGGKNHGRWFYTCQKSKGCKFFLWTDEAKTREESAVLNNSRSEPHEYVPPKTPQKQTSFAVPPTPKTDTRSPDTKFQAQPSPIRRHEPEEEFQWSSSDDEELLKAEQQVLERTLFETPKKVARTDNFTSPGKRNYVQMTDETIRGDDSWPLSDDVFTTPSTSHHSNTLGLPSPAETPASRTKHSEQPPSDNEPSSLATAAMRILRESDSQISRQVEHDLVDLLNKHDLRTQGIIKGRDITRLAVQTKDKKIAELQTRIQALEAEKETSRRVITHLKMDICTSPKKGQAKTIPPSRRSEV